LTKEKRSCIIRIATGKLNKEEKSGRRRNEDNQDVVLASWGGDSSYLDISELAKCPSR
jgi:hypothetical protein